MNLLESVSTLPQLGSDTPICTRMCQPGNCTVYAPRPGTCRGVLLRVCCRCAESRATRRDSWALCTWTVRTSLVTSASSQVMGHHTATIHEHGLAFHASRGPIKHMGCQGSIESHSRQPTQPTQHSCDEQGTCQIQSFAEHQLREPVLPALAA